MTLNLDMLEDEHEQDPQHSELERRFKRFEDLYLEDDLIKKAGGQNYCREMVALQLLQTFVPRAPRQGDFLFGGSEHDRLYLNIDKDLFQTHVTDVTLADLVRCGLCYSDDEGFYFHV